MNTESLLAGKTALITGASRGIGAAIYHSLATAGAQVIGTATSATGKETIEGTGLGRATIYDATQATAAAHLLAEIKELSVTPDILVINAAVNADGLMLRLPMEKWAYVMQTNLTAAFELIQGGIQKMIKNRHGRVICISSVVASTGNVGQANYCAAKAGLEGMCRSVAMEVASRGITVNAIAPGYINTDMTAQLPEAIQERLLEKIPMGRAGTPDDVSALALFLASESASYITGQVFHVNGGMYMG